MDMFLLINDLFRHNQVEIFSFLLLGFKHKAMLHGHKHTDSNMAQHDAWAHGNSKSYT